MNSPAIGLVLLLSVFLYSFKAGEEVTGEVNNDPPFISIPTPWADSLILKLSDEEKIAQLFMVAAYSNRDEDHEQELMNLIKKQKIGGLIYFQGGPIRQAKMCNRLQKDSEVPLLIGMDAEWGLAMRLEATYEEILATIHAHPTLSESVFEATGVAYGVSANF